MAELDNRIRKDLAFGGFSERKGELIKRMPVEWTIKPKDDDDRFCIVTITANYEDNDISVSTCMSTDALDLLLRKDEGVDRMLFEWFKKLLDKIYGRP